jgi:GNAT superfamily N-acetyltransferase
MTLSISLASPQDLAEVVRLLAAQLEEHAIALPATLEKAVAGMLEDPRRGRILLAGLGERAVGLACVSFTWTLDLGGHSAWLDELFVEPDLRSKGIGQALLRAAIEEARSTGAIAVDLEVVEGHERAARLYERHGFARRFRTRWALDL